MVETLKTSRLKKGKVYRVSKIIKKGIMDSEPLLTKKIIHL